jgi:hypothetical protein
VHQPSRLNRHIGVAGLIWFVYCTGSGLLALLRPHYLRQWSRFNWTDREIRIGA